MKEGERARGEQANLLLHLQGWVGEGDELLRIRCTNDEIVDKDYLVGNSCIFFIIFGIELVSRDFLFYSL